MVVIIATQVTPVHHICSCDCYILKDILQNWSDEDAANILKKLRKVVAAGNRLLVIERVMHTGSYSEERVRIVVGVTC